MKEYIYLAKRLFVLAVLLGCFGYVLLSNNSQIVQAAPRCNECEVFPGDNEISYCETLCEQSSRSCRSDCIARVHNCWSHCILDDNDDGGSNCGSNDDCTK